MSRKLHGTVVSDRMTKTVVVAVARVKEHPIYRKKYQVTARFKAHDETGSKIGDLVEISETRPMSAQKRWKVERKITSAEAEELS